MTVRLTVDEECWRGHVARVVRHSPGLIPVVKGNGYGFGRSELARIAAGLGDVIAVGTVHELAGLPGGATPMVLTPALRPPDDTRPVLTVGSARHVDALAGWRGRVVVKLASLMHRFGIDPADLGPLTTAIRRAGLEIVAFAVHPPLAGTDDEHADEIAAWLEVLDAEDEVWVSHLGLEGYEALVDAWPDRRFRIRRGSALWHGDKSSLHLGADVLEVRPVRRNTTAGYRQGPVPADGALVVIGAGTAHGVGLLADGRSPFHHDRRRLALIEPPHMHVSMAFVPAGEIGPAVGDVVDVQWPLISTAVDEVRWISTTTPAATAAAAADRTRLPGPDVVRAVALIGVVIMNYHGYLIIAGGDRGEGAAADLFDPWTGPLSTRFAATFVLTAGVGVTLLTRSATTPADIRARRWTLLRRGCVLFVAGWIVDEHWRGTILPYYGALFMLAAFLFRLRSAFLLAIGAVAAVAAALIAWWGLEQRLDGHDTSWLFGADRWTPQGLFFDTFVNGTHPLLPWLAFFCAGMVLGRVLRTGWWRPACFGIGLTLFGLATIVSDSSRSGERAAVLASNDPFDRGLLYVASALGMALIAFAGISWLAERFVGSWPVEALRHAGAMTLTLYLLHIVVFTAAVGWFDLVEPAGLDAALTFATAFWIVAIAGAWWYHRRFRIGPAEYVYRWLGG